jgi:cysteine desulfurase/selenocysteine lyase
MLFGAAIRTEFPFFDALGNNGNNLAYLDNAASTQKPRQVIDRLMTYLSYEHANVHRGAYSLSAQATDNFEASRAVVAKFLNSKQAKNIVFTKGTTDSINLAAFSLVDYLKEGDLILLSYLEHHSNIVPWQILSKRMGLKLAFVEINQAGELDLKDFSRKLKELKPKIVSITALSNAIGTTTPIELLVSEAKEHAALVLVDAAQILAHKKLNVEELGCDFLAFSGHKLYGPTGCGVLYCSDRVLDLMVPVQGGGEMISTVSTEGSTWAKIPHRFEAGTPAIAEVIALGTAISFLSDLIEQGLHSFEQDLHSRFYSALNEQEGIKIYGPGPASGNHSSILSFNLDGVHPHDLASIADSFNVQIRAGHHCAQPLMAKLGLQSSVRLSLACYSDRDHIDPLIAALNYARKVFR